MGVWIGAIVFAVSLFLFLLTLGIGYELYKNNSLSSKISFEQYLKTENTALLIVIAFFGGVFIFSIFWLIYDVISEVI